MKKVMFVTIAIFVLVIAVILVQKLEKNKMSPVERHYAENTDQTSDANENVSGPDNNGEDKTERYNIPNLFMIRNSIAKKKDFIKNGVAKYEINTIQAKVDMEVSEYFMIDEEEFLNTYDKIDFINPNAFYEPIDSENTWNYLLYKKIDEERPDLFDYKFLGVRKGEEEDRKLEDEWCEIAGESFFETRKPRSIYLFLKCKLTNVMKEPMTWYWYNNYCLVYQGNRAICNNELMCYFDKSQYMDRDYGDEDRQHSFFTYDFEPGESIECYIGYRLFSTDAYSDISFDDDFYWGIEDENMDVTKYTYEFGDYMFNVKDINKHEE